MKKYKIAIIGLGYWGKILLKDFSNYFDVLTCCTKGNKNNLSWLHENYPNIKQTTDYESVLFDEEIDVVVIATPINTHFPLAKKAILADKHVFLEKPPATNVKDLEELRKIALDNKKLLFIDHVFSYNPIFKKLKEELLNANISEISTEWLKDGKSEGNMLWNLAYHDFYLIFELLGKEEIKEVNKIIDEKNKASINIITKDKIKISLFIDNNSTKKEKIIRVITDAGIYIWKNRTLTFNKDVIFESDKLPLSIMVKHFKEMLDSNKIGISNDTTFKAVNILELLTSN